MRLDKIKLAGFKSFVDPTTIHFPSNLTGIIGPNGCGKSNTIDAVRWVMGESSAKNLRGDSMADVIFNGSTGRKPVGQASVELVFDNSAGKLGGEYAQYSEISLKRQVTRDGQSNYFLNGTRCRRKDITDIFLGTGLGPRSYAIIEQGMISRFIEAKPDELRVFIEEAAGISKYKERRRETENRIRHTRDNIDRINDLRDELEKRLATLQRQAKAAERYKELKEEERLIKAQLLALRWQALNEEFSVKEKEIARQETALEALIADLRKTEAMMESQRDEHAEANDKFNEVQGEYYSVGAEIARLEQAIQHAKETRFQQEKELQEIEQAWEEAQADLSNDNQRITELTEKLSHDEGLSEELKDKQQLSAALLSESESEMHAWQQLWDEFNHRASSQVRAAEVERAKIEHLEQSLAQLQERQSRLMNDVASFDTQSIESEIEILGSQFDVVSNDLVTLDSERSDIQGQIVEQKDQITRLGRELNEQREHVQSSRENLASLEALQAEALGKNESGINDWLEAQNLALASRLAQEIKVEKGWEKALEAVLGYRLESVCVESLDGLDEKITQIKQGALTLLDKAIPGHIQSNRTEQTLLNKVTSDWALDSLLSGVYVANSMADALSQRAKLQTHESIVIPDGVWLGPNWMRVSQAQSESGGLLERESLINELSNKLEAQSQTVAVIDEQLEQAKVTLQSLEEARENVLANRNEVARKQSELKAQLSGKQARFDSLKTRQERSQNELNEAKQQLEHQQAEVESAQTRLLQALAATEGHDVERDELIKQRDTHRLRLEDNRKQARTDQAQAHEVELRCQSMRSQLNATRENLSRIERQLEHTDRRRSELKESLSGGEGPIVEMQTELESHLEKRLEVEHRLLEVRKTVEAIDHSLRELNNQRLGHEQNIQSQRSELDQYRMANQELKVRRQTLLEQITEASYQVETLIKEMPEEANERAWVEHVERISRSIQRLGAINLAAIEEFAEQSERKKYLDDQFDDLTDALTTLENAIQKIDKETRTRFKDTFDKVNSGLQEKFPRLFGGGHAHLELTGEDLLDTGVTIMARPPGKKNSTIHLLSGGEKALTAVAMVFAIFELNPSPFCMLDEVDAPLDDANVGRFCNMVKEMSEQVQFIFITHNKVTMEMSQQLSGVTMSEPGVSRLVAVDIDEAVELAAAS